MACLDSSFIIDLWRGKKGAIEAKEKLKQSGELFFIPAPVIMELAAGAQLSRRIDAEKQKIRQFLSENSVLDFDTESAFRAGEIEAELEKRGQPIEPEDVMIGAIALENNESLVTGNARHFEKISGLRLESYETE